MVARAALARAARVVALLESLELGLIEHSVGARPLLASLAALAQSAPLAKLATLAPAPRVRLTAQALAVSAAVAA